MTKTESCLGTTDQVNGRGTVDKVFQALTRMKSSEQIGEARALTYQIAVRVYRRR